MDVETVAIWSGVAVVALAVAAKLVLAKVLSAKPVVVKNDD